MVKTGKVRRHQGLDKLERRVVAMHKPQQCFSIDLISENFSFFGTNLAMLKKYKFFIIALITIDWGTAAWPAELIFLTSALLMGALRATPAEPTSLIYRISKQAKPMPRIKSN